jgi:hypothetical protein
MPATIEPMRTPSTSWTSGPLRAPLATGSRQLIFGETYEDAAIELAAFAPRSRVFAIAGAGATARALAAAGHRVTAVDVNAAQVEYAKARTEGSVAEAGAAERLLAWGRALAVAAGWSRRRVEQFLELEDCAEQVAYWDRRLDTPAFRLAMETLLAPRLLQIWYRNPFVRSLPRNFGGAIRTRLRRGWATHANRGNPYAALLLAGKTPEAAHAPRLESAPIRFVCADAAEFLESVAPESFDAFALSNIGDGATANYMRRLRTVVERAATPGAVVVMRSFAEPANLAGGNWAARDRSLLWGVIEVGSASRMRDKSCCIS